MKENQPCWDKPQDKSAIFGVPLSKCPFHGRLGVSIFVGCRKVTVQGAEKR